jgi:hypothetical protein
MPLPALILSFAAAAGLPAVPAVPSAPPPGGSHHFSRIFISPMGEPFRAEGSGADMLAAWFNQADRNHDGQITPNEMQLDADRFFALLDTNHDGEIDPDETTHYEDVVAPEVRTGGGAGLVMMASADDTGGGGRGEGGGHRGGGGGHRGGGGGHRGGGNGGGSWAGGVREDGLQGAQRFSLLPLPEPVISADTNFNRGVSVEEFRQAAVLRFQALDVDHQGRLTLAVLESERPAPPARQKPRTDTVVPEPPGG